MPKRVIIHDFYCVNCGASIPLPRKAEREKGHRKKLWCWKCNLVVNHVECRNYKERQLFEKQFKAGAFAKEAKEEREFSDTVSLRTARSVGERN